MIYTSKTFWAGTAERAIKTAAQTTLASVAVGAGVTDVNWVALASIVGMATFLSVMSSIADPRRADTAIATGRETVVD